MSDEPRDIPGLRTNASQVMAAALPPSLRPQVSFDAAELATMKANAERWLADPESLRRQVKIDTLLLYQVFYKLATNPPGGRSGVQTAAKAAQKVVEMAARIMELPMGDPAPPPEGEPPAPPEGGRAVEQHPQPPRGQAAPPRRPRKAPKS